MKSYIIVLVVFFIIFVSIIILPFASKEEQIIQGFYENQELYIKSAEVMSQFNGSVHISSIDQVILSTVIAQKDWVKGCFEHNNLKAISKTDEYIAFICWSNKDIGKGIVFSFNDKSPELQFITKLVPLEIDNWYYYEEDFNKWRVKNDTH